MQLSFPFLDVEAGDYDLDVICNKDKLTDITYQGDVETRHQMGEIMGLYVCSQLRSLFTVTQFSYP